MAIWAGEEQKSFQAVIDGFKEQYPNVNVKYTSGGDNLAPLLSTAVQGGNPPDIAAIGQPGLMADFAEAGRDQADRRPARQDRRTTSARRSRTRAPSTASSTRSCSRARTSRPSGTTSPTSRRPASSRRRPGTTSTRPATRCKAAGITPYSVGVDVGWPISDLFENVYIRTGGRGEVRPAREARDPVDGPVGEGRADDHAGHRRRLGRPGRRHRRRAADRHAGVRREGVQRHPRRRRWSSSATSPRAS